MLIVFIHLIKDMINSLIPEHFVYQGNIIDVVHSTYAFQILEDVDVDGVR